MDAPSSFRVLDFSALDADAEPVRVRSIENDELRPFQSLRQTLAEFHRDTSQFIKLAQLTLVRRRGPRQARPHVTQRAPRGKPVRRRGSRRVTATRAGPEAGDPEPAGPGDPVGDTSRVLRTLVGGPA